MLHLKMLVLLLLLLRQLGRLTFRLRLVTDRDAHTHPPNAEISMQRVEAIFFKRFLAKFWLHLSNIFPVWAIFFKKFGQYFPVWPIFFNLADIFLNLAQYFSSLGNIFKNSSLFFQFGHYLSNSANFCQIWLIFFQFGFLQIWSHCR